MAIRCPHCGSPVMIRGRQWECGWCGDSGGIGSLPPSERAKLTQSTDDSCTLTFSVTVTNTSDDEDLPRYFSCAELEDMVRRWDFDEPELKERLRALAEENPCFDGFD